jgi:CHAT domain-containing protein
LLALGDPVFAPVESSSEPGPLPDHGLLLTVVIPGSNASRHGLKPGDVLLAYNGKRLQKREDFEAASGPGQPVPVEVWHDGRIDGRQLDRGQVGAVFDPRPAAVAIRDQRRLNQILTVARSGSEQLEPLPGTRYEVEALARIFESAGRPARVLTDTAASEPELDRMAASGDLGRFAFIHLATHGLIDQAIPQRSAVILTQTGLPDPLEQALKNRPVYDGRLAMREIQRSWDLKAELVTLSACETARGQLAGGEGFVGFTQALLMSGARSVCLSLWKVDDTATALLMQRFYANLLGARPGLTQPMPKAEALAEAKAWLRGLRGAEVATLAAELSGGEARAAGVTRRKPATRALRPPAGAGSDRPFAHPYYWAAFVLVGDPD